MSTENHGLKFVLDTSGIARGVKQYESAVEGIFASLDKFEEHVVKTMKGVAKAASNKNDINKFVGSFKALGNIKIDSKAANRISTLSAAMGGFKAPTAAQIANTKKFFTTLGGLPDLGAAFRSINNIANLNMALDRFKAPSPAQSKNLRAFGSAITAAAPGFAALRNITGISGIANELATISIALSGLKVPAKAHVANLSGMAKALRGFNFSNLSGAGQLGPILGMITSFRAPTAGQIKNLQSFINAVGNLKVPSNASALSKYLSEIARASALANSSLGGLRSNLGSLGGGLRGTGNAARGASIQMMGLQNAFSGTFQVGSALRTLLGSLTIGELGRKFFDATNAAESFRAGMSVISKEAGFANLQLGYINETANRLGVSLRAAQEGFTKFSISADKAGASVGFSRDTFEGFSTAMTVLGTSADRQKDVWLALQQMMSKGYASSEEINQQLNEQLPGALGYLREMLKGTGKVLEDELKNKTLDAEKTIAFLAKKYEQDFGPAMAAALQKPGAQMTILQNNIDMLFQKIGDSGATKAFANLLTTFNAALDPKAVNDFATGVGEGLASAVNKAAEAFNWLRENWDSIKGPLATTLTLLGKWMVLSGGLQIGKAIVSPLIAAYGAITTFGGALNRGQAALASFSAANRSSTAGLGFFRTATTTAVNGLYGLKGAVGGVIGAMGGPLGIALTAAAIGFASVSSRLMDVSSNLANVNPLINSTNALLDTLGLNGVGAAGAAKSVGAESAAAQSPIRAFAGEVGNAADQLYRMAAAQRVANIEALKGKLQKLKEQRDESFTFTDAGQRKKQQNINSVGSFLSTMKNGAAMLTDRVLWNGANIAKSEQSVGALNDQIMKTSRALTDYVAKPMETEVNGGMRRIVAPDGSGERPDDPKIKPKKGPKGPKAKTPEQLYKAEETYLNKLAAKADDIMKRFAEDDPIAKLTSDYVTDVTEQAQRLLTNDAFKKWKEGLQADAKDGVIAVTGLSAALKGTGVQQDVLAELSKRYGISVDDLTAKLNAQEAAYQRNVAKQKEEMTFGATMLKTMQAESRMMLLSNRDQEVAAKLLEEVNRFKEKGWEITQKQIDATRQQIDAQVKLNETMARQKAFFDNNGVRNYVNDTRTLGEAVNDMDRNALQGLEDTLHTLGTTGKLSFKSLIDGMQSDIIRFAAQDITKSLVGRLFSNGELEGGTPSIMGGLMKTMGFGDYQKDGVSGPKLGESYANPMYVWSVNADGTLQVGGKAGTGTVADAFKALSGTAANDNAPYGANPLGLSVDGVAEAMNSEITTGITGSAQTMQSSFGGVIQGLGGMMGNIFGSIGNMLQSLIGGGAGGAGGGAGGGLGSLLGGGGAGGLGGGLAGAGIGSMAGGLLGSLFGKKGKKWGSILGGVAGAAFGLGMFKEGGLTSSPVARGSMSASAFVNAPHYKEGTANTSGGIPAILHDNEAVIPLSRGRAVPVEVNGGSGGSGGSTQVINQNFNISTPNADSFRRSKQQIGTQMYVSSARAHRRNAGG